MNPFKPLVGAALIAGLALGSSAYAQETITVVSFGGAYGAAQQKHQIEPYMAETGNKVLFENYTGGIAEIKAQVESGKIQWDVVDIETIDLERACAEGLLEVIPRDILLPSPDGVSAEEDFFPSALENECGVGEIIWSTVFAYNKDTIGGAAPSSMQDLFDLEKFPGKRALRKKPQVNLEWALLADGVPADQVYAELSTDEGQKRAFNKLDSIKDEIVWFDSWSQAPQLLNDGGAVMVQSANGRFFDAINSENKPFVIVWDGHLYDLDVWGIVKGTPRLKTALDFVSFTTSTKALAGFQDVAYGPPRHSSAALVDKDVVDHLPSTHVDVGVKADGIFWADFGETLSEQFNEWLLN